MTKKEFYENKKGIKLKDVIVNNITVSEKVKGNNDIKMVKTLFDNDKIPEEKIEHKCIPCISVDCFINRKKMVSTSLFRTV